MADENDLVDCGRVVGEFDERHINGVLAIQDLLQQPFERHVATFEIPVTLRELLSTDEVNAIVTWYLNWKITEPLDSQTTCTIKNIFGIYDASRAIVAINLYKYLRNKGYDPEVVEKFITQQ